MSRYIIKRLLLLIPVVIGVSLLIYVIMASAPGDAALAIVGENAPPELLERTRKELGLDQPLLMRYLNYMWNLLRGDLGKSYISDRNVVETYLEKLPYTLLLALTGTVLAVAISLPLGVIAALRRGTILDGTLMVLALVGLSMPLFWLGLLLIIQFSLRWPILPSGGAGSWQHLVLPAVTLAVNKIALLTRTTRSSMLEVINEDYIRTARAKGVSKRKTVTRHALRNALIPIVTVIGTQMSASIGGSVLCETVFSWPGVGRLIVDSIGKRDVPMVTGCIILTTLIVALVNLLVDFIYGFLDPRIKGQYARK